MGGVFISYARKDVAIARKVAEALRQRGHEVWYDADLPAHRAYSETIEQKLNESSAVVVLWSADAARSQWVRAEADAARAQEKIVQARTDTSLPPMPFNQIQCAELKGWRGSEKNEGWRKLLASVEALCSPTVDRPRVREDTALGSARSLVYAVAAAFALLVAGWIGWSILQPAGDARPVVAVLPFDNLGSPDEGLVAGLWEDTRQAIGRNPQLLVLGAHTARELSEKDSGAIAGVADYVVDGNVRAAGDKVRVSVSLVRTEDQSDVWSETFERRLDDVFALQSEIAREIEGKIRGRLAADGGTLPEQIATSGEVYALYTQAREKLKRRGLDASEAFAMLKEVVRKDPNFAPGWAALSVAGRFRAPVDLLRDDIRGTPEAHARRAIALAPKLAAGYSALALAFNLEGPVAEQALHKAVQLDRNDAETLNWLANVYGQKGEPEQAIDLYREAIRIEPLWWPPYLNLIKKLADLGRDEEIEALLRDIRQLQSPLLETQAELTVLTDAGELAEAARRGLAFVRSASPSDRDLIGSELAAILVQTGHLEQAASIANLPPFALPAWKNEATAIPFLDDPNVADTAFWSVQVLPLVAARTLMNHGQGKRVVERYDGLGGGPERLRAVGNSRLGFLSVAPLVSIALRSAGREEDAVALNDLALRESGLHGPPPHDLARVFHSRLLAVRGDTKEAARIVEKAVDDGWRPTIAVFLPDLLADPALALLRDEPAFRRARQKILRHFERERRKLGPVTV